MDRKIDLIEKKIDRFKEKQVAASYEYRRFGGRGGHYVNCREKDMVLGYLINVKGKILDIGCGTGRYIEALIENGQPVVGLDYSMEMLKNAMRKEGIKKRLVQGDAFHLPFIDGAFQGIIINRVFQHFKDLTPFLFEAKRVCGRDGIIVFDTLKWSPRLIHFWFSKNDSRGIFRHTYDDIISALNVTGFNLCHFTSCFILSPGLYRFLCGAIIKLLDCAEKTFPARLLAKNFWVVNPAPKQWCRVKKQINK